MRCGSGVSLNSVGLPVSHQNSHYWGRGNWGTRFDPENCITLCTYCHFKWGGDDRRLYEEFMRKRLGEKAYKNLEIRKNMYVKKDPKLVLLYVRGLYKI